MNTANAATPATEASRSTIVLASLRGLFHLLAIVSVTIWGALAWTFPLPGLFTGLGFLVLSVVVWALFLSPRPVLPTDRFGQALIELLLLAAAVAALLDFGFFWVWPVLFGVAGAVVGYAASTRAR